MPREGCQNGPISYNSVMAEQIVTTILCAVIAHVAMHLPQVMGDVHLHVRTCVRADVPQCFVSQERLDGLR